MFALMHKYRAPVLWTCVFLMVGFGAWALLADSFRPERPVKELGTFVLPTGEKASVTDAELAELQQMLQANRISVSFDERGQNPIARELGVQVESPRELLWAYLVLRESARAGGFTMTDDAVRTAYNESFVKPSGGEEISEADWRKRGSAFREFFGDLLAIKRFRGSLSPVEDATYAKLFEKFKTDYEELRAEFVFFDGTTIATPMDPRASAEDRVELDKWLRDDAQKGFRQQEQISEEGEFEVLYVNFRDLSNLEFDAKFELKWQPEIARAGITVTDDEVRARFDEHAESYHVLADTLFPETRPTGESVFDRLKERVRRELLVVKLFGVVREQLTRPDSAPTFEQIRDLYDFKLSPPVKLDAAKTVTQPEFGSPAASAAIFEGFRTGALKPGDVLDYAAEPKVAKGAVDEPGRSVSIWRVLGRREARDPTIDDPGVLDKAIAKYKEKKRQDEVKRLAEEFRKAVEEKTAAAAKPAEEKAEADAKAAIEAEISKQGLSRDDPQHKAKIVSLEAQENAKEAAAVAEARAAAEPEAFRAVAGEKSYVVRETGWMRKNVARPAQFRAEDAETLSLDEKLARFFRKPIRMNQLAALKAGRMGQVDLEPAWAAAAVSRLVERREPKPTDLYALSEAQMSQLKRAAAPTTPVSWNYEAFKSPQWFHLDAPNLEEARKERADRAARDAERTRREEERKNETRRRRAAKLVEDFRDPASPIKSGEGW